jgi:hypothetical protein
MESLKNLLIMTATIVRKRVRNIHLILESLRNQSQCHDVWLWDNDGIASQSKDVAWHVRSSENIRGSGTLMMMRMLESRFWVYMDDDNMPKLTEPDLLRDVLDVVKTQNKDQLVAAHGFRARQGATYQQCQSLDTEEPAKDIRVDMCKFRIVAGWSEPVRDLPFPFPTYNNDLHVSMLLAGKRRHHHLVSSVFHGRMKNLPEGDEAYSKRSDHYPTRDRLMQQWLATANGQ